MTARLMIALGCFAALQAGCVNPHYVDAPNNVPVAVARVIGPDGVAATGMVTFPFSGSPVAVMLDGAASTDSDGRIASYQWIATDPMMPAMRIVQKVATPQLMVQLGQGTWTFSLWVTDNKNKVSTPGKVTFVVGMPTMMGGAGGASGGAGMAAPALSAMQCVDMTETMVPMACKTCLCNIESCRPQVIKTACDASCWALINCIGANCPTNPASCIASACGPQYAAYMMGTTSTGATAAGMCAVMCPNDCGSMM